MDGYEVWSAEEWAAGLGPKLWCLDAVSSKSKLKVATILDLYFVSHNTACWLVAVGGC